MPHLRHWFKFSSYVHDEVWRAYDGYCSGLPYLYYCYTMVWFSTIWDFSVLLKKKSKHARWIQAYIASAVRRILWLTRRLYTLLKTSQLDSRRDYICQYRLEIAAETHDDTVDTITSARCDCSSVCICDMIKLIAGQTEDNLRTRLCLALHRHPELLTAPTPTTGDFPASQVSEVVVTCVSAGMYTAAGPTKHPPGNAYGCVSMLMYRHMCFTEACPHFT